MGSYNYQVLGWPAQPRSKKRREANIAAGGGAFSPGGGAGADVDLSGYIRIADLIKTTSDASVSEFLDTNAMSSLMVKTLLDQKANTIHDHNSQLIRPAVLVVPQIDPSDAGFSLASGEVAEFISHDGSFAESSGSVTPADLKDLTLKINGVTQTTYNPASAAQFNVDLTNYALKSWVEAKNYLQGITKAMVENVLTGNITSHTHSQYLTSHQSLSGYATVAWVQQQGYLTSHQSLADYALKSEIPTSMAWSSITGKPTKLSDFTNDIISAWALSATKPSYSWNEITSKPTTLSGYGITDGYSSLSTTGRGNAITGVSGSGHALTFTKGNTFVDLASEQTISGKKHISYLDVTGALAIPQEEPTSESGKVFEYIDNSGSFGEAASAITPADLKDLVLKVNGVTVTTYNPATAASFNVDLTAYATQSWVEAKNYLQGITKAMVEAVLTGNITSHTHSQYLTSHQSLTGYATQTWVQQQGYLTSHQSLANYYTKTQADAKFLTEHQSLEDYALKSEIPTSMVWTAITGRPTKLSDLTNDIISSWALAASKPSYSWSEIGSKPSSLSGYGISDGTPKIEAIPYIVGPSTDTAGVWTGTYEGITEYTEGLTIIYVPGKAGVSGGTTLNINGLGAKTCYTTGSSVLTTHYAAGTPILFTYHNNGWRRADYNSNSDVYIRVYRQTTGYDDDYPILLSRTKSPGTAGTNASYTAVYGLMGDTHQPTINPMTGEMKAVKVTATTLQGSLAWSYLTGKPTNLSDFTNDIISSWALAATKPSYSWTEITSRPTTLASFSGDSTHRLVTDTQISNWNSAYGWGNHADAGYLTSFTESDPTVPAWAKTTTKPSYTLDEVTDGTSRKLSDYMLSSAFTKSAITTLLGNNTYAAYNANGYLPLNGGTLTGNLTTQANQTFDVTSATRSIYYTDSSNNTLRAMMFNNNGHLSIGYDGPGKGKSTYLDGLSVITRFGSTKKYTLTLSGDDGTIRSSTGANLLSIGYRSGNTIYPFKNIYSTFHIATKCLGATNGTVLYGVARFAIANTKKARTFAIKIPSSMGAYVTFKIVMYSPYNYCPASTITVNAGAFNLTSGNFCALYPSYSVEGSFAGRVAFARDGDTSSSNMYILLGSYGDGQQYQGGMIAIDSIIHSDTVTNADTIMNFGYTLLDLDDEIMFTKITECANADAHFKSVTVSDSVTAPKIDCTNMFLVPTSEPSSVPAGKVAEYIDINSGSFAN